MNFSQVYRLYLSLSIKLCDMANMWQNIPPLVPKTITQKLDDICERTTPLSLRISSHHAVWCHTSPYSGLRVKNSRSTSLPRFKLDLLFLMHGPGCPTTKYTICFNRLRVVRPFNDRHVSGLGAATTSGANSKRENSRCILDTIWLIWP